MSAPTLDWEGQQGSAWAAEWKRTDRSFSGVTEQLLARSRRFAYTSLLDVGCGAGELSLALARSRQDARVLGVDISPQLVSAAKERATNLANVSFEVGDAARWQPAEDFRPDLIISRHGVMFFDDPVSAFRNLSKAAAAGAGLLFSCFRSQKDNPFFTQAAKFIPRQDASRDPFAPGPFAFADADHVRGILEAAGWGDVRFEAFDCAMIVGAGADPVDEAVHYYMRIGPAARYAAEIDDAGRAEFARKLRGLAEENCRDGIVALRAGIWIVTASLT